MHQISRLRLIAALGRSAACFCLIGVGGSVRAAPPPLPPAPVEALVYSTMPSTAAHRPEMALDNDTGTYFRSAYGMGDGDDFLVLLGRPIPVQSLRVTTGDAEGEDTLSDAFVETSPDAIHYSTAASFDSKGVAAAALGNRPVQALRIRLNKGKGASALLVREITLTSRAKITHVAFGPGRGFYDIPREPDLAIWAQRAETQMESFWPDTAALLYTDGFITPNMVNVVYRTGPGVTGVAATGGGVMTVNTAWCHAHPDDTGLTVHETAHVVQSIPSYNPVWLIEGIADYIRWVKFEPQNFQWGINPAKSTYHDSYRTSAAFLAWCELHYDSRLVTKLNQDVRSGTYSNDLFLKYCGKDADTLWTEFVAAYKTDRANIITPPTAAADRPRTLPTVKPESSTSVDLSTAFNATGIASDGKTLPQTGGFDGEGSTYSASLLGASPTVGGVTFRLGPAGAANLVACRGQVIPLPSGSFSSLWLLGAAVEGGQRGQTFTVTYADGTTDTLAQNFSDWFQPQNFPGETRAMKMPYRNTANGARDARTFYAYRYGFHVNGAKTVKSLTLPNNEYVKILGITLAQDADQLGANPIPK